MSLFTQVTNFLGFGDGLTQSQIDRNLYIYEGGEPDTDIDGFTYGYNPLEEEYVGESKSIFGGDSEFSADTPSSVSDTASFMGYKIPAAFKKLKGVVGEGSSPLGQQRRRTTKKTSPDRFSGRPSRISDPRGESSAQRQLRLVTNTKGSLARVDSEALLLNKIVEKLSDSHYSKTTPAGETITLASSKSLRGQIAPRSRIT